MNVESFLTKKSCFSWLKLKTGCYIIGVLYLMSGFLYFLEQLIYAVKTFAKTPDKGVFVLLDHDITPAVIVVLCFVFLYGLYKDDTFFIFQGIPVLSLALFLEMIDIVDVLIKYAQGYNDFDTNYILDLLMFSALHIFALIIILTYRKQTSLVNEPERIETRTNTFHEVENTLANIQIA